MQISIYSRLLVALALVVVPVSASANLTIQGSVNGGDITTATERKSALQVPYSKPIFVQGFVANRGEETVHLTQVTVSPNIIFFPTLKYPVDSRIGANQTRSDERTVTFQDMVTKYVPKSLASWLNNTTASVTVKAYSNGALLDSRTIWIHISDDVEVVPQSAIAAIGGSPIAQVGAGIAGLSAAAAVANTARRRKGKKGPSYAGAAVTSVGMAIGTAAVLMAIGAIDFLEFMAVAKGGGPVAAGVLSFLCQIFAAGKKA